MSRPIVEAVVSDHERLFEIRERQIRYQRIEHRKIILGPGDPLLFSVDVGILEASDFCFTHVNMLTTATSLG